MKNDKSLLIWDSPERVPDGDDYKILWQGYSETCLNKETSILKYIEDNSEEIRSTYLSFIYDLGEVRFSGKRVVDHLEIGQNFSYWWMTLLVEKCNYSKSPQINNIVKLISLSKYLECEQFITIKLVTSSQELKKSIKILTEYIGVNFECTSFTHDVKRKNLVRKIYGSMPDVIKAPISLLSYLSERWELKGVGLDRWKESNATITFVTYFANFDYESADRGVFEDKFWTKLPGLLSQNNERSNWLHLYVKSQYTPTPKSAKYLIQRFNQSSNDKQNHLFLDSFLSLQVLIRTVFDWVKVSSKHGKIKSKFKDKANYFWPHIEADLSSSLVGPTAIRNILFYNLFKAAMQVSPIQNKGLYLQENQGWEFGFIGAWKEFNHGKLIGIPHSTVSYWDLRYFFDKRCYERNILPMPDKVGVNGDNMKNTYIVGKYPEDDLLELEALRYLNYDRQSREGYTGNTVLVLGDYLPEYMQKQMLLLEGACKLIDSKPINFVVKPHPMCPIISKDYPGVDMVITNRPIHDIINSCMFVYVSSTTSAAIDAYCSGKHVVTILDQSKLNLSPLLGLKDVTFVSNSRDLASIINDNKIDRLEKIQRVDYFYLNKKIPRWRGLLLDSNTKNKENL